VVGWRKVQRLGHDQRRLATLLDQCAFDDVDRQDATWRGPAALGAKRRSLVRRCHLWANLEEQEARTEGLSSQGILEVADLRKSTARMAVQYRRPQLLKKWLAPISPFSVFRASPPQAEMVWPAAASRSTEDGAEAWGAAGARDGPMAGSQDRRFPRAGMKNSFYINGD